MAVPVTILVIDANVDNGMLLVRSIARKLPEAVVLLRQDSVSAMAAMTGEPVSVIVVHRTDEEDAATLIGRFREMSSDIPILAVSGLDRSGKLLQAGATAFLNYEEWLRAGTVVTALLAAAQTERKRDAALDAE